MAHRSSEGSQAPAGTVRGDDDFVAVLKEEATTSVLEARATERLVDSAVTSIPKMVMNMFHNANGGVPDVFYEKRGRGAGLEVVLTPSLHQVAGTAQPFDAELEARWSGVEMAFASGLPTSVLGLRTHSDEAAPRRTGDVEDLFVPRRRRSVTRTGDALSGFQNGRCFHCKESLGLDARDIHVDHVFPWSMLNRLRITDINLDGLWNLVASCATCNLRKSARMPSPRMMEDLVARYESLMGSKVPLRQGLIVSFDWHGRGTSTNPTSRRRFIDNVASHISR